MCCAVIFYDQFIEKKSVSPLENVIIRKIHVLNPRSPLENAMRRNVLKPVSSPFCVCFVFKPSTCMLDLT